ncbi:MAG TPA: hypothetical protein VGL99_01155 [Chloroflexota bacterium]|jgi:hypothetical protein
MSGQIVTVGATLLCPHSGQVSIVSANTRVLLNGQPAATQTDTYPIVGCTFMVGTKPQPCVRVQWLVPATRVLVSKQAVIVDNSSGLCLSAEQIPQGQPKVVMTQVRVRAS